MTNFAIKQAATFASNMIAASLQATPFKTVSFTGGFDVVEFGESLIELRFACSLIPAFAGEQALNQKAYMAIQVHDGRISVIEMRVFDVHDDDDDDDDADVDSGLTFKVPMSFDLIQANVMSLSNFSATVAQIVHHHVVARFIEEVRNNTLIISLLPWQYALAMSQPTRIINSTVQELFDLVTLFDIPDNVALLEDRPTQLSLTCTSFEIESKDKVDAPLPVADTEEDHDDQDDLDDDESFSDIATNFGDDWESEIDPDYYKPIDRSDVLSTFPESDPRFVLARKFIPATPIYRGMMGIPNWLRNPETIVANSVQLQVLPLTDNDFDTPDSKSPYMQDIYTGFVLSLGSKYLVTVFKTTVTQPKGVAGLSMYSVRSYVFMAPRWDVEEQQLDLVKFINKADTNLEMVDQRTNANVSKSIIRSTLHTMHKVASMAGFGKEYQAFEIGNPEQFWAQNRSGS